MWFGVKREYSKIIETIFMLTYLWGIVIGSYTVVVDPSMLDSLLVYIGGSTTIATSFYFWKARCENLIKLKKENPNIDDISSLVGDDGYSG